MVFFFKQKTAYEMRISDWSSDVCSSDLVAPANVAGRVERHQLDRIRQRKVRAEHGAEPTKSALRSPTTYLTQWRVADSRAESMRMRSGAEIARYDRTARSIAGHRANEWAGCASCSKLIVPPIDTTMRQKHSARGIHILGREDGTIAIQPCSSGSVNSVGSTLPNIQSPRSAWGGASPSASARIIRSSKATKVFRSNSVETSMPIAPPSRRSCSAPPSWPWRPSRGPSE